MGKVLNESEIRNRIEELETKLKANEELYKTATYPYDKRILMNSYNIESQLDALHYVLGEKYTYKHM